jgi:hypothetical protein
VIGGTTYLIGSQERISFMGVDGYSPDIAYNPTDYEYLVVWTGYHSAGSGAEIFGQRIDALFFGGWLVGTNFQISNVDPDGDVLPGSVPAVAYNIADNQYLVVWAGGGFAPDFEIFGQRLDAATGGALGADDFAISNMSLQTDFHYYRPDVAHDRVYNEYLVVWWDEDYYDPNPDYEIFAQRLDGATGLPLGADDFPVSDMGPAGVPGYLAIRPAVAHNPTDDEYLVAWTGRDQYRSPFTYDDIEILGQRLGAWGIEHSIFFDGFESGNTSAWSSTVGGP